MSAADCGLTHSGKGASEACAKMSSDAFQTSKFSRVRKGTEFCEDESVFSRFAQHSIFRSLFISLSLRLFPNSPHFRRQFHRASALQRFSFGN
jgi:hypothetical protein